ncbi:hypothetical protein MRX96_022447 [Rhipicephalus microplus]
MPIATVASFRFGRSREKWSWERHLASGAKKRTDHRDPGEIERKERKDGRKCGGPSEEYPYSPILPARPAPRAKTAEQLSQTSLIQRWPR